MAVKIIYASSGLSLDTLLEHLDTFYRTHANIPHHRRPNVIHVAGRYVIFRFMPGMFLADKKTKAETPLEPNTFVPFTEDPDINAIVWTLNNLQINAMASSHIMYDYQGINNEVMGL